MQTTEEATIMIRTKDQLMAALAGGKLLFGQMGNRPSSPWRYRVDGDVATTVHGNAFWAAEKAGLLKRVRGDWNYCAYRAKNTRNLLS
jgi:hypothetical protein